MARIKRVSDELIMRAAFEGMIERGPALTLAEVGEKVGLSAATIVQRFGSKRELMLRVARGWAKQTGLPADGDGTPIERVIGRMTELLELVPTPDGVANVNAALHLDLGDPEFRIVIAKGYAAQRQAVSSMLDEAIKAGQIKRCDTEDLARQLQVARHGGMQNWAVDPVGDLHEWIVSCLETTLAPYRISDEAEEEAA